MTTKISIVLGLIIIASLVADIALFGTVHVVFLGKRFYELIDWVAFWR
ncbi:hypothetical protein [Parasedimentitalea psychrophila]|uniref:Uncharacterized protein n=1 Tax=Parasedimentitalea psychrophila TaxID=2997337 RepID=A0A9Y2KZL7_9RHOB|nr:hypothetical protein [Parasedimentitalea psychrophila]WIY24951.1 hypothetical protein QPJ95_21045 [Parasedimentitalea psychrophila]